MPFKPSRTSFKRQRPAPRKATGAPSPITDNVSWTRIVDPRERYRITYRDRDGELSERVIELQKIGDSQGVEYLGVMHGSRFKTLRVDRVVGVLQQLSTGHACSIEPQPSYSSSLPAFALDNAQYKIPTTAVGNRTWTVDLNHYTCTCPEKRIRTAMGYDPGQLGHVCDHMAKAILQNLPPNADGWSAGLLKFLADPRKIHIHNVS